MANVANFDAHTADAYISKVLGAIPGGYKIQVYYKITSSCLANLFSAGPRETAQLVRAELGSFFRPTSAFGHPNGSSSNYGWYSQAVDVTSSPPLGNPLPLDAYTLLELDVLLASGTSWDQTLKVGGSTVINVTGHNYGVDDTSSVTLKIGAPAAQHVTGESYRIAYVKVTNAAGSTVIEDDFVSGSFATQGWTVTGAATIVSDGSWAGFAPVNTVAPVISGTMSVGATLTATNGTWLNSPSFTYQWQRDNSGGGVFSDIVAATASTYVLQIADLGCKIRCVVTGTNGAGTASANSNQLDFVTVFSFYPDGSQQGVCVAFTDTTFAASPTWFRIDDPAFVDVVKVWDVDRGRSSELDKSKTGTASIQIVDLNGVLDPTNALSPVFFLGAGAGVDPMRQVSINLKHPISETWFQVYRGFVDEWSFTLDVVENRLEGTIECVDGFALLARTEVVPDNTKPVGAGGTGAQVLVPTDSAGDVFYEDGQVDDRIRAALADAGWPPALTQIFTGNVDVQETVYAVRDQILQIIQDAADAEFPGVANVYMSKDGWVTFHGRKARFDPAGTAFGTAWNFQTWKVGDRAAWFSDATYLPIRSLLFNRGMNFVVNAALATPKGILDADIQGQVSVDTGSIATFGVSSASWENLLTKNGTDDGFNANQETKLFSDYYKNNLADPRNRISQIVVGNVTRGHIREGVVWDFLVGVEIGDVVTVTTTHPGGGGFNEDFFVEGVAYNCQPVGVDDYHLVELTVDLSPTAYFTSNPFS